jgi:YidC/Oxa1 family membrane protein insertase
MAGALRYVLIALIGLLAYRFFFAEGSGGAQKQPVADDPRVAPATRAPYSYCELKTEGFQATLTTRGAALTHFWLLTPKYQKKGVVTDLSTTPHPGLPLGSPLAEDPSAPGEHEFRQQLFSQWRNVTSTVDALDTTEWNVPFDSMDYTLRPSDPGSCEFVYEDAAVRIVKRVAATGKPYELQVTNEITNLAAEPRKHAFALDTVAWHLNKEVDGGMFGVRSPFLTHLECIPREGDARRLTQQEFDPDDFRNNDRFEVLAPWGFYQMRADVAAAAVSNSYFTQALMPAQAPVAPHCQLLIERRYQGGHASDPTSGAYYRARLGYTPMKLGPGEQARYVAINYVGPKERELLAAAGSGQSRLLELIDLGFFSVIAKVLVAFLLKVHNAVPNWGVAIIVLTLTARTLLFPLSWPSIRNMIRMRELKPELDALNSRFKDDAQARGLAQMELYRKHNVNPFKGCLPQLASMPVWYALYTTLQTAVELYNIPFLWFPDLSASDPYFILPLVIGSTYFVQQKLMPMQGGDPTQQKIMMYMMPGMFTVFMLFLPAGLGIYMFTNSVLAIAQQQVVERVVRRSVHSGSVVVAGSAKEERKAQA